MSNPIYWSCESKPGTWFSLYGGSLRLASSNNDCCAKTLGAFGLLSSKPPCKSVGDGLALYTAFPCAS